MLQVETTAPVYSNFGKKKVNPSSVIPSGTPTKQETRQLDRQNRRTDRKAKRNAPKLKRVKRKNGSSALVMKLIKLVPVRKQKFSGADAVLTAIIPTSTEYTKTFEDGTTIIIPASDVIVNTAGVFDKSDIARAFGVTKETLTPEMIDKYLVYLVPTPSNATTTTETDKSPTADVSIVIDPTKVVVTPEGEFLKTDVQDPNAPVVNVADEQKAEQKPLVKWEKYLLWGGIGVGVLIIGYIIYKKTTNKGGKK